MEKYRFDKPIDIIEGLDYQFFPDTQDEWVRYKDVQKKIERLKKLAMKHLDAQTELKKLLREAVEEEMTWEEFKLWEPEWRNRVQQKLKGK